MLNVAVKAARAAGAVINRAALDVESVRISEKNINDFVTEVDQECEQIIIETLLGAYPDHGILAEESGSSMVMRPQTTSGSLTLWMAPPTLFTAFPFIV